MNLLLLFLFFFKLPTHDIQVAIFKVYQEDKTYCVDIVFEKEDILKKLKINDSNFSDGQLQNYLRESFSIIINSQVQDLNYGNVEIKNKHIHIKGSISKPIQAIRSLEINNTCLLNIDGHSNIIKIRIDDQERDFLMNSERTNIKLNY